MPSGLISSEIFCLNLFLSFVFFFPFFFSFCVLNQFRFLTFIASKQLNWVLRRFWFRVHIQLLFIVVVVFPPWFIFCFLFSFLGVAKIVFCWSVYDWTVYYLVFGDMKVAFDKDKFFLMIIVILAYFSPSKNRIYEFKLFIFTYFSSVWNLACSH